MCVVPLPPTGLKMTNDSEIPTLTNVTVTFEWDPPGSGPGAVVDYYTVTTTPAPLSPNISIENTSLSLNIIFEFNVVYDISIRGTNCIGEGNPSDSIEYSKCTVLRKL